MIFVQLYFYDNFLLNTHVMFLFFLFIILIFVSIYIFLYKPTSCHTNYRSNNTNIRI